MGSYRKLSLYTEGAYFLKITWHSGTLQAAPNWKMHNAWNLRLLRTSLYMRDNKSILVEGHRYSSCWLRLILRAMILSNKEATLWQMMQAWACHWRAFSRRESTRFKKSCSSADSTPGSDLNFPLDVPVCLLETGGAHKRLQDNSTIRLRQKRTKCAQKQQQSPPPKKSDPPRKGARCATKSLRV